MSAARRTIDSIHDALRSGAPLTAHMRQRAFAALRDIRDRDGDAVARDYRAKLQGAALMRAAELMGMKSARSVRPTPRGSRGVPATADDLRRMQATFIESMRIRGIDYDN